MSIDDDASFRFIDLFAGLGGFHVALKRLGGEAVFAAESNPTLNELYRENFNLDAWTDVNSLSSSAIITSEVPDHDVLTAGFRASRSQKPGSNSDSNIRCKDSCSLGCSIFFGRSVPRRFHT